MYKDRGIVFVALGKTYERVAAACVAHSRRHTDLPFVVYTDVPLAERETAWLTIERCQVIDTDIDWRDNRHIKTALHKYTPFDRTLFIDCDAAIVKPGVETFFDKLDNADFVLCPRIDPPRAGLLPEFYAHIYRRLGVRLPVTTWYGAIFAFDKTNPRAVECLEQ